MSAEDEREKAIHKFAVRISECIDRIKSEREPAKVVELSAVRGARREPQLSDAELVAIRKMLVEHEKIRKGCPTARHIVEFE